MDYKITYHVQNTYHDSVTEALFEFQIMPCNDDSQAVLSCEIVNSLGEPVFNFNNLFGFRAGRIRSTKPFKTFDLTLKCLVQKKKMSLPLTKMLNPKEEATLLASTDFLIDHHLYLTRTDFTHLSPTTKNKIFNLKKGQGALEYLNLLNEHIGSLLEYHKNTTDVKTTAEEALKLKTGVCQDFAHVFIGMARLQNIPVRYVSGYLNPLKKFLGTAQMHAWVEAYIPQVGWMGFDPANKRMADDNYLKVSHGADYADCSPIKGVLKTTGDNKTVHHVKVVVQ